MSDLSNLFFGGISVAYPKQVIPIGTANLGGKKC